MSPRVRRLGILILLIATMALGPMVLGPNLLSITILILFSAIGALALSFLTGVVGQVSLGHSAFIAIGAFAAAGVGAHGVDSIPVAVLIGFVVASGIGVLTALPAFRLEGFYLALSTLAMHALVIYLLLRWQHHEWGAGSATVPIGQLFGLRLATDVEWWFLLFPTVVLLAWVFVRIKNGSWGRACLLVRDASDVTPTLGIDPRAVKVLAFAVTSGITGVQGALFGYYIGSVNAESFTLHVSVQYLVMVVVGGLGSAGGAIAGAAFVTSVPYLVDDLASGWLSTAAPQLNSSQVALAIYGSLAFACLAFQPSGLAGLVRHARHRARQRMGART